jgi:hypothetical protein
MRATWRCLLAPGLLAAGGKHVVTDFVDGVVQVLESFDDPLPRRVMGQADSSLQAQADLEQAADNPVEQVLTAVCLFGRHSSPGQLHQVITLPGLGEVPDHRQGEMTASGRHWAEADLDRERDPVLAQRDQPRPSTHGPGLGGACA